MPRKIRIRIIISLKNWIRIRIKSFWVRHIAYPYRHRKSRARCDHLSTHDVPTYSRKFCPPILSSSANLSIIFCLQLSSSSFSLATTASLPVKTQKKSFKNKNYVFRDSVLDLWNSVWFAPRYWSFVRAFSAVLKTKYILSLFPLALSLGSRTQILRLLRRKKKQCCGFGSAWIWNLILDPELLIRIQQKMKEQINKKIKSSNFRPMNSGLCVLLVCIMKYKMADTVVGTVDSSFW